MKSLLDCLLVSMGCINHFTHYISLHRREDKKRLQGGKNTTLEFLVRQLNGSTLLAGVVAS